VLSVTFNPVRRGQAEDLGELLEAFALCYLASYNGVGASTRCFTSYLRAWGMTNMRTFPRLSDGTPAFVVAYYGTGNTRKVVIAIEGMSSLGTLLDWCGDTTGTHYASDAYSGTVFKKFDDCAQSILNQISASGFLGSSSTMQDWTIAGYSLGAAVAEIIGYFRLTSASQAPTKVYKFGSPRVGNDNWLNGIRERNLDYRCVYLSNDPIFGYPTPLPNRRIGSPLTLNSTLEWYQQDPKGYQLLFPSDEWAGIPNFNVIDSAAMLRLLAAPMTYPTNPWIFHKMATYRQALATLAQIRGFNLNFYRFWYLEFPDDNTFAKVYQAGGYTDPSSFFVTDPPPDDVVVPPEVLITQPAAPSATPSIGSAVSGSWSNQAASMSSGGDWGYTGPQGATHRAGRRNPIGP
jgi:Lipase (class 3)